MTNVVYTPFVILVHHVNVALDLSSIRECSHENAYLLQIPFSHNNNIINAKVCQDLWIFVTVSRKGY